MNRLEAVESRSGFSDKGMMRETLGGVGLAAVIAAVLSGSLVVMALNNTTSALSSCGTFNLLLLIGIGALIIGIVIGILARQLVAMMILFTIAAIALGLAIGGFSGTGCFVFP